MLRGIWLVLAKDVLLEWRSRARILAVVLFGVVALALFSFAADADIAVLQSTAAGFLVLALILSSTLGLAESFRMEQDDEAIEGLLLLPIDPVALFYGKALSKYVTKADYKSLKKDKPALKKKIEDAFKAAEKEKVKSDDGETTFGELIEAGKLPITK